MSIDFTPLEEDRYDRQRLIEWWDQDCLAAAHVLVAGAGALGNEVLKLLALSGIGHITVVDYDVVARSNLSRTVLFRESDLGRPKVQAAAERLYDLNPDVQVTPIQGDLRFDLGLGDYRRANLVFGCLDSVNARWALNRRCQLAGVSWIDGGISDYHGLVTHYSTSGGACYECTFTAVTLERFNRRYSCPFGLLAEDAGRKVPTTAVTTSAVAALQVQQALLLLHGRMEEALLPGERAMLFLKPFILNRDRLPTNPECLAHEHLPRTIAPAGFDNTATVLQVLAAARRHLSRPAELELGYDLVLSFTCPGCGRCQDILRPRDKVRHAETTCPDCGQMREPLIISRVEENSPAAGLPLAALGIPPREVLRLRAGQEQIFLEIN